MPQHYPLSRPSHTLLPSVTMRSLTSTGGNETCTCMHACAPPASRAAVLDTGASSLDFELPSLSHVAALLEATPVSGRSDTGKWNRPYAEEEGGV